MPAQAMAPGAQRGAAQPPTPTHGQTVAILRHMHAIQKELTAIMKDPAVGRSNVKSKIIDGVANLVSSRMITPGDAVSQLASVPDQPFQQKQWLELHLAQSVIAQLKVLNDHGKAFGGAPENMVDKTSDKDNHLNDIQGAMGHYGRG